MHQPSMFRRYVDEVGTDDMSNLEIDHHRYLSLTGVAMKKTHARDYLVPVFIKMSSCHDSPFGSYPW